MRLYHAQEREGGEGKPHSPVAQLTDVDCVGEPGPLLVGLREREAALRRLSGGCFSVALPCVCTRGVTGAGSEARRRRGLRCLRDWRRITSGEAERDGSLRPRSVHDHWVLRGVQNHEAP